MKKLMVAALALATGVALAEGEITSANIVGYNQNKTDAGAVRFTALTFSKIGATSRTLGDLVPTSLSGTGKFRGGNFNITFFDAKGDQRLVKNDTQLTTLYPAVATDAAVMDSPVSFAYSAAEAGWYIVNDYSTKKYPVNDYQINDGDGFQVFCSANQFPQGVAFTCSGQVLDEVMPITIAAGAVGFTGNTTLKKVTLGSLTPVSVSGTGKFRGGSFNITFFDAKGDQALVKNDTQIAKLYPAAITDAEVMDSPVSFAYKADVGWFIVNDYSSQKYPMNSYEIDIGAGFQMFCSANQFPQGVTINLPSALK